ncbi:predicted protein [Sclerotinia sclerotiorum 1980 UF-70]|uniref:Uncharacterized protein n=1 Tax=Sclerotinia sclerotiorum (strain ATCC 18683 / 1980 / Ss-1) TaxID=665079 RepID=A7F8M0_SCLS1|nr:predicted protein [Sclerotinia sclerotiorum 1980 UF-70]EDN99091.1 predicted protein [Sclerotinia sclerotiorum 1980 UF-70]
MFYQRKNFVSHVGHITLHNDKNGEGIDKVFKIPHFPMEGISMNLSKLLIISPQNNKLRIALGKIEANLIVAKERGRIGEEIRKDVEVA